MSELIGKRDKDIPPSYAGKVPRARHIRILFLPFHRVVSDCLLKAITIAIDWNRFHVTKTNISIVSLL